MTESGGVATHVPFKGGTTPMMELLAGRGDVMMTPRPAEFRTRVDGEIRQLGRVVAERKIEAQ
jgi:tripartite-type tricarboxylate transporter receptor subunit TctC